MPALRYFTVIQSRRVKVSATNILDAASLANRVLNGEKEPQDQINVHEDPIEVSLSINEDSNV